VVEAVLKGPYTSERRGKKKAVHFNSRRNEKKYLNTGRKKRGDDG